MKTLFKLLAIAFIFTSCEDTEPIIYNGNFNQNDTYLSFSKSVYTLPVERDGVGELTVVFNSSTVTDTDRVYNIEVALPDNESAANPQTFTVPATVTILAGSYQGFLNITGVDNNLVDATIKTFTITVTNTDETFEYSDSLTATVNVYEVCNILDDFLGAYQVSMPNLNLTDTPFIGSEVVLQEGDSPFERVITVESPYIDYGVPSIQLTISLACGSSSFNDLPFDTGLACSTGNNLIVINDQNNIGSYNTEDDSSFTIRVIENSASACGGSPVFTTITFTKIE